MIGEPHNGNNMFLFIITKHNARVNIVTTRNEYSPPKVESQDFLEMACISANVSYRGKLTKQELVSALVTGKVPKNKLPQLRVVFDELPSSVFDGLVRQVGAFSPAEKLSRNISVIAMDIHSQKRSTYSTSSQLLEQQKIGKET